MLHSSVSKSSLQEVLDLHMENWNRLQKLPQSSGITDDCISADVSPDYSLSPQKKLCCYLWIYIPFMLNMAKSDGKKIYFTNLPTPVQTSCSYKPVLWREGYKYLEVKEKQTSPKCLCPKCTHYTHLWLENEICAVRQILLPSAHLHPIVSVKCSWLWISSGSRWEWFINSLKDCNVVPFAFLWTSFLC